MSEICEKTHHFFSNQPRFSFPFNEKLISRNGIYILFEKGQEAHGVDRIVRVGTHTGDNQLRSRLKQHFVNENKDRSIFRKNIGRCILNKRNDPYLSVWELDSTAKKEKEKNLPNINHEYQASIEEEVTDYIQYHFTFCVIECNSKEDRLRLESRLISTVSRCTECSPSKDWFGLFSPKQKIRESGLWLVNELYKEPLMMEEFEEITSICRNKILT